MSLPRKILSLASKLSKRKSGFFNDYTKSFASNAKTGLVKSKQVAQTFGVDDVLEVGDAVKTKLDVGILREFRKGLEPIFGKDIVHSGQRYSVSTILSDIKANINVFQPGFYEAQRLVKSGTLRLEDVAKYSTQVNRKVMKQAVSNFLKQEIFPYYSKLSRKYGISYASSKRLHEGVLQYDKAILAKDKRAVNQAVSIIRGQIKGEAGVALASNRKGLIADFIDDFWETKHRLPDQYIKDAMGLHGLNKLKGDTIVAQIRGTYNKPPGDFFRNDNIRLLDTLIATAKKNNVPLENLQKWINKDINKVLMNSLKRDKRFKNWSTEELTKFMNYFAWTPKAVKLKDGSLKVTNVLLSGDHSIGGAPVHTYIKPGYKKAERFLSDVYDGGTIGKFNFNKGFKHNMKVLLNRGWRAGNQGQVMQVSKVYNVRNLDNPLLALRSSPMWIKAKGRAGFKSSVKKISDMTGLSKGMVEDEVLIRLNRIIQQKVSSGQSPLLAMDDLMSQFQSNISNTETVKKLVEGIYRDPKLAVALLGDASQTGALKNVRAISEARKLKKGRGPTKYQTFSKKEQELMDLISEGESRGMKGSELIEWVTRNLSKAALVGGGASIVYNLFSED